MKAKTLNITKQRGLVEALRMIRLAPSSFTEKSAFSSLTEAQREEVLATYRIYTETWVVPEIEAALK